MLNFKDEIFPNLNKYININIPKTKFIPKNLNFFISKKEEYIRSQIKIKSNELDSKNSFDLMSEVNNINDYCKEIHKIDIFKCIVFLFKESFNTSIYLDLFYIKVVYVNYRRLTFRDTLNYFEIKNCLPKFKKSNLSFLTNSEKNILMFLLSFLKKSRKKFALQNRDILNYFESELKSSVCSKNEVNFNDFMDFIVNFPEILYTEKIHTHINNIFEKKQLVKIYMSALKLDSNIILTLENNVFNYLNPESVIKTLLNNFNKNKFSSDFYILILFINFYIKNNYLSEYSVLKILSSNENNRLFLVKYLDYLNLNLNLLSENDIIKLPTKINYNFYYEKLDKSKHYLLKNKMLLQNKYIFPNFDSIFELTQEQYDNFYQAYNLYEYTYDKSRISNEVLFVNLLITNPFLLYSEKIINDNPDKKPVFYAAFFIQFLMSNDKLIREKYLKIDFFYILNTFLKDRHKNMEYLKPKIDGFLNDYEIIFNFFSGLDLVKVNLLINNLKFKKVYQYHNLKNNFVYYLNSNKVMEKIVSINDCSLNIVNKIFVNNKKSFMDYFLKSDNCYKKIMIKYNFINLKNNPEIKKEINQFTRDNIDLYESNENLRKDSDIYLI